MSDHAGGSSLSSMTDHLSRPTPIFGLRLIVVLGVSAGAAFVLLLFLLSLWIISRRSRTTKSKTRSNSNHPQSSSAATAAAAGGSNWSIPPVCKEIQVDNSVPDSQQLLLLKKQHQQKKGDEEREIESSTSSSNPFGVGYKRIQIEIGKDHRIFYPEKLSESRSGEHSGSGGNVNNGGCGVPEVSHLGWGHWYTLRELEETTNGLADENVIGSGGYGIVYHGILQDGSQIAVKNLLNNKYSYIFPYFLVLANLILYV